MNYYKLQRTPQSELFTKLETLNAKIIITKVWKATKAATIAKVELNSISSFQLNYISNQGLVLGHGNFNPNPFLLKSINWFLERLIFNINCNSLLMLCL